MKLMRWLPAAAIAAAVCLAPTLVRADDEKTMPEPSGDAKMMPGGEGADMLEGGKDVSNGPLNRLLKSKKLDLTAEQTQKIQAIQNDLMAKNKPLKDKIHSTEGYPGEKNMNEIKNMSKEDRKKAAETHQAWRKQHPELDSTFKEMNTNRKAAWDQAMAVLTPEQQAAVKGRMNEMRGKGGMKGQGGGGKGKSKTTTTSVPETK